jgi:dynein heavy chain
MVNRYAIGECNYGGRVTDDKDRRLLMAALGRVYRPEILTDTPFQLSASGQYTVLPAGDHAAYLAHIAALPVFALPEVRREM